MNFFKLVSTLTLVIFASEALYAKGMLSISRNEVTNGNASLDNFSSFLDLQFLRSKETSTNYSYSYDINVRKYNNDDTPLVSIPFLYLEKKYEGQSTLSLGRKLVTWNDAISFWNLGEVFSTQGFDLLEDRDEGLSGLHYNFKNDNFSFSFFASGFFVPSLNPGLDIGDGKISARSEWSALPPQFVSLEGQVIPIEYNVDIPSLNKLLLKESLAINLGINTGIGDFTIYGGRKPENSFRVNATGFLDQSGDDKVVVSARPFTNMQNFFGGTWTKKWSDRFVTSVGYESILPDRGVGERYEIGGFAVEPVYNNISYSSFLARYKSDFWGVDFSYLYAFSRYQSAGEAFARRLRFENAVAISPFFQVSDNFILNAKYQYDQDNRDHIIVSKGLYRISKRTAVSLRYQMIESPGDDSFWSRYRENDLWQANLSFNF